MKWANLVVNDHACVGLIENDRAYLLERPDVKDILTDLPAAAERAKAGGSIPLSGVRIRQPILRPGKILGIGLNYAAHAKESVSFIKASPAGVQKWFNKQSTAANGPYDPIELPVVSEQLDYEAELVAIIGRTGRHVPEDRAHEIIAGYCLRL